MFRIEMVFVLYLMVLSFFDSRTRRLPFLLLLVGFPMAALVGLWNKVPVMWAAGGVAVGIGFLLLSKVTGEAFGYGDSILITEMGVFLGLWNLMWMLFGAFFLAALYGAVLFLKRRLAKRTAFPFVPFLTLSFVGGMIGGLY